MRVTHSATGLRRTKFDAPKNTRVAGFIRAAFVLVAAAIVGLIGGDSPRAADRIVGFTPRVFAVTGARIVVRPGETIDEGTLVIRDGVIVAVGKAGEVEVPADAQSVDAQGHVVYAAFIDAGTSALVDGDKRPTPVAGRNIDFGRYILAATPPDNRRLLTPEFAVRDGLKREGAKLEAFRKAGFAAAHVVPTGRIASGTGTLISTEDLPLREAVIAPDSLAAFRLYAPGGNEYPSTLMGTTAHLRQAFLDAERDALHRELFEQRTPGVERPVFDEALAALEQVRSGERRALFTVTTRDDIHRALDFAAEREIAATLWGARDAHRAVDRLKKENVDVVLQADFGKEPKIERQPASDKLVAEIKPPVRVQQEELDRWKRRVGTAAALEEAGVRFAFGSQGLDDPAKLLEAVRTAIEHGLSADAALAALTTNPAAMLGVEHRLGTLEAEKAGHVVVLTGPLEHEQAKVRHLFVDGRQYEYNESAKPVEPVKPGEKPALQVAGKWNVVIESASGKVPGTLELSQDGARLTGRFVSEQGNGRVAAGKADDAGIELTVSIGAGDREVDLKFTGKLAEGKLAGELKSPFGAPAPWSAQRDDEKDGAGEDENPVTIDIAAEEGSDGAKPQAEWPTELEADRLRRPFETKGNVFIKNATVITGTGETLQEASIVVRDGKIAAVGKDVERPEGDIAVIDATGRYVMPGIIDTHSHIMIEGGVNEYTQSVVPEVRIKDAIDTSDVAQYRALAGGTTAARVFHGSANVIGGQDAVVRFKHGEPARAQILDDAPQGVKFALGENVKGRRDRFPNTRLGVEATLNRAFLEAIDYRRQWNAFELAEKKRAAEAKAAGGNGGGEKAASPSVLPPRRDLRLEALADIVDHKKFIHSHCYRADEILMLLRTARDLGIRVWSLQHVLEGYKIAPEIVAHGASCSTFADWWAYKVEAFDATPYNAALLDEAGANVVIKSDNAELIRHLNLEAAKAIRYGGMPPDRAIQAVTRNAARELGLHDRLGTIEPGKLADMAIYNGHPLSTFSRCEIALVGGEVYYHREGAPTVMSEKQRERSKQAPPLEFASDEVREKKLDLEPHANGRYAIVGATLHPVDGPVIEKGTLVVEDGNIAALGKSNDVDVPTDAKVIDAKGLHVYPGLIDAGTTLGLTEIDRLRETHDFAESGLLQPDIRAGVAVNVDSELIPAARAGGITSILIRPNGGLIGGQASTVQLAGWTAEEMVLEYEAGLVIGWPEGKDAKKQREQLEEFFEQAREYDRVRAAAEKRSSNKSDSESDDSASDDFDGGVVDPRLEAMRPYLHAKKPVFIEAYTRQQIAEALLFAEKWKLKPVITGGRDAWKLADELKKRDVPVIVGPVMVPPAEHDPLDAPYANPGRLHEAGVKFCIRSDSAWNSRNAPFEAGMAVAFGLPEEEALRAVTLSAAEIVGLGDSLGSLTVGKRANLLIGDGTPLQPSSQVKAVFIAGRPFAPESRQTRFYERYRQRLAEKRGENASKVTDRPRE
ncbi:MAG: amidohydrolase family protein [Planctomycetaceae bacterium]